MRIKESQAFKKDLKRIGLSAPLVHILHLLLNKEALPPSARSHGLKGGLGGFLECHVKPDLLLLYRIQEDTLELGRLGTHADIFKL
ncbi:type II toxin-antitoxin system RelE/ParE family toxin [Helicobacter vulpis]|uniref:type II toxin-antitoxin system RelE/ParE family toxin n=1 Tax=Helicobacter vulpis TaxID=2316076 RepID=UPI000EAE8BFD|nr:type II toxin-antitoxin system YafQ family toxin [Helicobacter vulpis]